MLSSRYPQKFSPFGCHLFASTQLVWLWPCSHRRVLRSNWTRTVWHSNCLLYEFLTNMDFSRGMDPVRINLAAYALLKWVWTLSPILTNGSNTRTWIWNYTPMHALLNSSTILDLDTPIRVGLVKSNMATHLLFSGNMGKCSSFLHLVFWPISLTLGISLPTVTSKAKLWPCQRTRGTKDVHIKMVSSGPCRKWKMENP